MRCKKALPARLGRYKKNRRSGVAWLERAQRAQQAHETRTKVRYPSAYPSNQSPSPFSLAGRSPSTNHALMHASGLANWSLGCLMRARLSRKRTKRPLSGGRSKTTLGFVSGFTIVFALLVVLLSCLLLSRFSVQV
jgi:hypothetical protein